jgi:hypothetical protein
MSLSELLEQLARIFPYILKQSLILREILCNTRGFFGCINTSEGGALRDALSFAIFLILLDLLIYIPIDSLVWQIDPLSPVAVHDCETPRLGVHAAAESGASCVALTAAGVW